MNELLRAYVREECTLDPGSLTPLKQFTSEFRLSLPRAERSSWTSGRVRAELVIEGFVVGKCGNGRLHVAGLRINTTGWQLDAQGYLEPVANL